MSWLILLIWFEIVSQTQNFPSIRSSFFPEIIRKLTVTLILLLKLKSR